MSSVAQNAPPRPAPQATQKPPLKWVGGKTQIMGTVLTHFPRRALNYHEPFMGGGSVLFATLHLIETGQFIVAGKVNAYDINPHLINFYNQLKTNRESLYTETQALVDQYQEIGSGPGPEPAANRKPDTIEAARTSQESFYYWCRIRFNAERKTNRDSVGCAALFVFLNKMCFRGVYRESLGGGFNVPFGHYKTVPTVLPRDQLDRMSDLVQGVSFECADFRQSLARVVPGDFVYLDPPYAPEEKNSFVGYTADGFGTNDHAELFGICNSMASDGAMFAMSNARVPMVTDAFEQNEGMGAQKYAFTDVPARRAINSKNPAARTVEVIVTNVTDDKKVI